MICGFYGSIMYFVLDSLVLDNDFTKAVLLNVILRLLRVNKKTKIILRTFWSNFIENSFDSQSYLLTAQFSFLNTAMYNLMDL